MNRWEPLAPTRHFLLLTGYFLFTDHYLHPLEMVVWENPHSSAVPEILRPTRLVPKPMPHSHHLSSAFWYSIWTSAGRLNYVHMPKCTELLLRDNLIRYVHERAVELVYRWVYNVMKMMNVSNVRTNMHLRWRHGHIRLKKKLLLTQSHGWSLWVAPPTYPLFSVLNKKNRLYAKPV